MMELIIQVDSKVVSTNIQHFEQQANAFIAGLQTTFETDEDFAQAEKEIATLTTLEARTKAAADLAVKSSKDISQLVNIALEIAERFRQERLYRSNLVKEKKEETKNNLINARKQEIFDLIESAKQNNPKIAHAIGLAIYKDSIENAVNAEVKNKKSIVTMTNALDALVQEYKADILDLSIILNERYDLFPENYMYLFNDIHVLISHVSKFSEQDLLDLIDQRINEENERQEKLRLELELRERKRLMELERERKLQEEIATRKASEAVQAKLQKAEEETVAVEPTPTKLVRPSSLVRKPTEQSTQTIPKITTTPKKTTSTFKLTLIVEDTQQHVDELVEYISEYPGEIDVKDFVLTKE